ncbi:MAG TPA: glycosyltransferase [Deltaproteobacteria bacterium]|nr:glycosyltransferase [Deltaproteobacteria bacterium]
MEKKSIRGRGGPAPLFARVDRERLDLSRAKSASFNISFPAAASAVGCDEYFVVVDVYSAHSHVHPEGHVGWWRYDLGGWDDINVKVSRAGRRLSVSFKGSGRSVDQWINDDCPRAGDDVLAVSVVIRSSETDAIEFEDRIFLYTDRAALRRSEQLRREAAAVPASIKRLPARWFCWPRDVKVHIVACNIRSLDAVGNFTFDLYRFFSSQGIGCRIYAQSFDPALRGLISHVCELLYSAGERDLVIFNFSIYDEYLRAIAALPCRKIVYYHNITPPSMFQIYDAEYAQYCSKAYGQFRILKDFDVVMVNSLMSKREFLELVEREPDESEASGEAEGFEDADGQDDPAGTPAGGSRDGAPPVLVAPPFLAGPRKWETVEEEDVEIPQASELLLYVGRIAPHKKIEDLLHLYDEYRRLSRASRLLIVGAASFKGYGNYINYLLEKEFPRIKERIHIYNDVSDGQLKRLYSAATAYVSMSEHEGYCIPVVEAMAFGKPVFAYAQEAVRETLGGTGRVFHEKDFPAIARDIHGVLTDGSELEKMLAAQGRRLARIEREADGTTLWRAVEAALFGHAGDL